MLSHFFLRLFVCLFCSVLSCSICLPFGLCPSVCLSVCVAVVLAVAAVLVVVGVVRNSRLGHNLLQRLTCRYHRCHCLQKAKLPVAFFEPSGYLAQPAQPIVLVRNPQPREQLLPALNLKLVSRIKLKLLVGKTEPVRYLAHPAQPVLLVRKL